MHRPGSPLVLSYKGRDPDDELMQWVRNGDVGGIVLFRDNCTDESALRDAISSTRQASPHPLYIMIDEEGGRVRRLPDAPTSMTDLRDYEHRPLSELDDAYRKVSKRLKALDIDTLLAPVVDIGDDRAAWLTSRTLSDDPKRVADMAKSVIPAIQAEGVHACAKHFPGTGRVTLDPHHGPVTCAIDVGEWESVERGPFDAAIAIQVHMILVGHQVMEGFGETLPACLSPSIPKFLLRRHLGYQGLIVTDDLGMGAISTMFPIEESVDLALAAGCDLVLICNNRDAQRRAVEHARKRVSIS